MAQNEINRLENLLIRGKKNNLKGLKLLNTKEINAAIKKTVWPGRLEIINYKNKKIILDGSHNIDGADKLNEFLKTKKIKPIVLFGMLNNKKASLFLNRIKKRVRQPRLTGMILNAEMYSAHARIK